MFKSKNENQEENLLKMNLQLFAEQDEDEKDDQAEDNVNEDDNQPGEGAKKQEKTFSQEQVNKMMTREKKQGRNSILKELGINPNDEKALEGLKNLIASQKSDEQLANEKEIAMKEALDEAEQRVIMAEAKAEAMMAGIKSQYVEDAVTLALAKINEDTPLKNVLVEFKTKYPIWFDDSKDEDDNSKVGQRGTGSAVKGEKKLEAEKGIGARLAAQRKVSGKTSSYWTNS